MIGQALIEVGPIGAAGAVIGVVVLIFTLALTGRSR
jgi:hypothetical protein